MSRIIRSLGGLLIGCTVLGAASVAATAYGDRKEELKEAFASRRAALEAAKSQGKIGESFTGYIEPVQASAFDDAALKSLVAQENKDRREAYQGIADSAGVSLADVAARGAAKHFQQAKRGDYLKHADGQWRKKA